MITDDPRERESVLRDLESDDDEVRRLAVERCVALARDQVVPLLVDRLGDPSWRVRKAAIERLAAWPDAEASVRALIGALADGENPGRRNAAVDALIQCGRDRVPQLVDAMATPDVDVRKFLVDVLAGVADASAVPALIESLEDGDANVRAAAADALGVIGGEAASGALVATAIADHEDGLVRFSSLRALASLRVGVSTQELSGALGDPVLRPAALEVLGHTGGEGAVDVLLKALEDRSRATREAAMRSLLRGLSEIDGEPTEELVRRVRETASRSSELVVSAMERLSEADLSTRLLLVQFLGLLRVPETAVPLLLAGADEALREVVLASLESMGSISEQAIDEVFLDLGADARRDACAFFGRVRGDATARRLVSALHDADPVVREVAARAIAARGVTAALGPLVQRLTQSSLENDDAGDERAAVTEALIALARPDGVRDPGESAARATELLVQALEGAPEPVRVSIARVIGCIGRREDSEVVSLLLKDASAGVRCAAVEALARLEPGAAAEPLHLAIADESVDVRIGAAAALGASASPEVFPDLCRLAEDADLRVRAKAVRSVGLRAAEMADAQREQADRVLDRACGDAAPVALAVIEAAIVCGPPLERMEGLVQRPEPEVVREAVRCIGLHGEMSQLEAVIPLCAHPEWSVRAEAIQVLADRGVTRGLPAILRRLDLEQDEFVRSVTLRALERLEG